jgi:16S rRNA (cytosine1402-N4)-methyltransferase
MHKSVLLKEVVKFLDIIPNGLYLDATFGNGGHSIEILKFLNKYAKLFTFDKDVSSFKKSCNLSDYDKRIFSYNKSFKKINIIKKFDSFIRLDGIIIDLGLSLNQIRNSTQGFNFNNGFLDMRLNNICSVRALDWINFANIEDLEKIFFLLDNKNVSQYLVKYINFYRSKNSIKTIYDFLLILKIICLKKKFIFKKIDVIFQSIRIFINNDLFEIIVFLDKIKFLLKKNGICIILCFNSLEDKIVKNFILNNKENFFIINKKIKPCIKEINMNYSSRSCIMRIIKKTA